jgi:hypothetical protein
MARPTVAGLPPAQALTHAPCAPRPPGETPWAEGVLALAGLGDECEGGMADIYGLAMAGRRMMDFPGRKLAAELGDVSFSAVQRIWRKHGVRPHRLDTHMVSNDLDFQTKAGDVIGLNCTFVNRPVQVQNNLESQRRQYALVDRARQLG